MRGYDAIYIGAALVVVPMLAWLLGRFAGRRDWSILSLLGASLILTALLQLPLVYRIAGGVIPSGVLSAEGQVGGPEFSAFLFIFGVLLAMLGWSSVPAARGLNGNGNGAEAKH
jgi:hypothetical protein